MGNIFRENLELELQLSYNQLGRGDRVRAFVDAVLSGDPLPYIYFLVNYRPPYEVIRQYRQVGKDMPHRIDGLHSVLKELPILCGAAGVLPDVRQYR